MFDTGVRILGLSCAASLKEGSIVSKNGSEFVDPLVWVYPLLWISFFKLNDEDCGLCSNIRVLEIGRIELVLNDEKVLRVAFRSVLIELITMIKCGLLK